MGVKPIPDGYEAATPYLAVEDAAAAIEFYKEAFGATERVLMHGPDGKIGHAELAIGDALIMLADPFPGSSTTAPKKLGGTSASVFLYVEDVDSVVNRAVKAGAQVTQEVDDMFWGDRFGSVKDPFGHVWSIATHVKDLTPEEIAEGAKQAMGAGDMSG